jgi:hypothetical protein
MCAYIPPRANNVISSWVWLCTVVQQHSNACNHVHVSRAITKLAKLPLCTPMRANTRAGMAQPLRMAQKQMPQMEACG